MTITEINSKLKNVKKTGSGKILLHCHAGCSTESIVETLGLKMSDLFADNKKSTPQKPKRQSKTVEAEYLYYDLEGKVIHKTIRYNPKSFSQARSNPKEPGKWIYSLKDVKPIIYNLPQVVAAILSLLLYSFKFLLQF